jgi:hypothetical protein
MRVRVERALVARAVARGSRSAAGAARTRQHERGSAAPRSRTLALERVLEAANAPRGSRAHRAQGEAPCPGHQLPGRCGRSSRSAVLGRRWPRGAAAEPSEASLRAQVASALVAARTLLRSKPRRPAGARRARAACIGGMPRPFPVHVLRRCPSSPARRRLRPAWCARLAQKKAAARGPRRTRRAPASTSGRCVPPRVRVVEHDDVAAARDRAHAASRAHRVLRRAEVHRHVRRLARAGAPRRRTAPPRSRGARGCWG